MLEKTIAFPMDARGGEEAGDYTHSVPGGALWGDALDAVAAKGSCELSPTERLGVSWALHRGTPTGASTLVQIPNTVDLRTLPAPYSVRYNAFPRPTYEGKLLCSNSPEKLQTHGVSMSTNPQLVGGRSMNEGRALTPSDGPIDFFISHILRNDANPTSRATIGECALYLSGDGQVRVHGDAWTSDWALDGRVDFHQADYLLDALRGAAPQVTGRGGFYLTRPVRHGMNYAASGRFHVLSGSVHAAVVYGPQGALSSVLGTKPEGNYYSRTSAGIYRGIGKVSQRMELSRADNMRIVAFGDRPVSAPAVMHHPDADSINWGNYGAMYTVECELVNKENFPAAVGVYFTFSQAGRHRPGVFDGRVANTFFHGKLEAGTLPRQQVTLRKSSVAEDIFVRIMSVPMRPQERKVVQVKIPAVTLCSYPHALYAIAYY